MVDDCLQRLTSEADNSGECPRVQERIGDPSELLETLELMA